MCHHAWLDVEKENGASDANTDQFLEEAKSAMQTCVWEISSGVCSGSTPMKVKENEMILLQLARIEAGFRLLNIND